MITAAEAKAKVRLNSESERLYHRAQEWTEESIRKAIDSGFTHTTLCYCTATARDGTVYDFEDRIKRWLVSYGYTFKPTGVIGGVRQDSEEICWD